MVPYVLYFANTRFEQDLAPHAELARRILENEFGGAQAVVDIKLAFDRLQRDTLLAQQDIGASTDPIGIDVRWKTAAATALDAVFTATLDQPVEEELTGLSDVQFELAAPADSELTDQDAWVDAYLDVVLDAEPGEDEDWERQYGEELWRTRGHASPVLVAPRDGFVGIARRSSASEPLARHLLGGVGFPLERDGSGGRGGRRLRHRHQEPAMQMTAQAQAAQTRQAPISVFAMVGAVVRAAAPKWIPTDSLKGLEVSESSWDEWVRASVADCNFAWPGR